MKWPGQLCPDQTFLSLCHRRHVAARCMLYNVISNSNHCLFNELPSASVRFYIIELRLQLTLQGLKYHGVERPNSQNVACRPRLCVEWPSLHCLTPECQIGLREQSIVGCFLQFVFQFSVAQVLVGLRKQFTNNFVFPHLGLCCWF